ncbi:3'-5' exoribonuclease [Luteimonas fraxinea]|uniref:3'-5' exoribonuclease n=1 Tax=Luteimonas fraxinea TaxID=2901869 RepID=UPI001E3F858D|nr:3'-5' exoribonuclease [Luteimonas fraxinea]MCD9127675.1 3'-5' exoribonuclease [Luteimonas fraxinea]
MTYIFLDTEWADAGGSDLVSLALVADDGVRELYLEVELLPETPTEFVASTVYPLLERGQRVASVAEFSSRVRSFLNEAAPAYVLADNRNDLTLLKHVLASGADGRREQHPIQVKPIVMTEMLKDQAFQQRIEGWFAASPERAKLRHHALTDARALRYAWMLATNRDP